LELSKWLPRYREIARSLNLNWNDDQKAADLLSVLMARNFTPLDRLKAEVVGRRVIVFGAGPSLTEDVMRLHKASLLERFCLISADGATSAILERGSIRPNVIATDLDGRVEDQIYASEKGSIAVVHAHGDNIPLLNRYVSRFRNRLGSTQVEPRKGVYNFGGFTDGDRAAFLSVELGANMLVLAGMDFGDSVGKYSKAGSFSLDMKVAKLKIGLALLEWLATGTQIPLYNVTRKGSPIKGFKRAEVSDLQRLL
jgi:uncharacterized Rossmann fold enzyme